MSNTEHPSYIQMGGGWVKYAGMPRNASHFVNAAMAEDLPAPRHIFPVSAGDAKGTVFSWANVTLVATITGFWARDYTQLHDSQPLTPTRAALQVAELLGEGK